MPRVNDSRREQARQIKIGDRFGRLVAIEGPSRRPGSNRWWFLCRCDCGTEKAIRSYQLGCKRGTRSCGCLQSETASRTLHRRNTTHGLAARGKQAPEYGAWTKLRGRCLDRKDKAFQNYGGRGITVCERWRESFAAFYQDMGSRPGPKYSVDRINNDGGYWCGRQSCADCGPIGRKPNCRWATKIEQANNTRKNVFIEHDGRRMSLSQWSRVAGIDEQSLRERIDAGWSIADALGRPPRSKRQVLEYNGERRSPAEWSRIMKISRETIYYRLRVGWSVAEALTVQPRMSTRKT